MAKGNAKGKNFYGDNVTGAIDKACKNFSATQEELNIEILETGSAGIFGLCKKKAHIRVQKKNEARQESGAEKEAQPLKAANTQPPKSEKVEKSSRTEEKSEPEAEEQETAAPESAPQDSSEQEKKQEPAVEKKEQSAPEKTPEKKTQQPPTGQIEERTPPSDEVLEAISRDIEELLEIMGFPSSVSVGMEDNSVLCRMSEEHLDAIVGKDGRTLDSLQYLLRKMTSKQLPPRMMLSLDVGNYRQQRAEELKERASQLAERVAEDGKTQAIPALNPSERRVVHMVLQENNAIRSRSVGDGLFKKVLIYKPGKKKPKKKKANTGRGKAKK